MRPLFGLSEPQKNLQNQYRDKFGEDQWINISKALDVLGEGDFFTLVAESIQKDREIELEWDPLSNDALIGAKLKDPEN